MDAEIDVLEQAVEDKPERTAPFDLSEFRYDGPWPEEIPPDDECEVINGGSLKASELLKGNTQPVLAFRRAVWEEIRYLVGRTPHTEMAMFVVLKQIDSNIPKYVGIDLHFPVQAVGATGVRVDAPLMDAFYETLNSHPDYREHMHRRLCHLHSHASMGCTWSEVDKAQQLSRDDLGFFDSFRFFAVVNTSGEARCCFVQYEPFTRRFDNLPVVILGKADPGGLSEERKAVLDSWIAERTETLKENVFADIPAYEEAVTEEYRPVVYEERPKVTCWQPKAGTRQWKWRGTAGWGETEHWWEDEALYGCDARYSAFGRDRALPAMPAGSGVVPDFVNFCIGRASGLSVMTGEELRDIDEYLANVRTETAVELRAVLDGMSSRDRSDMYLGFVELVDLHEENVEEIPEVLLEWLDWLKENEHNLTIMGPYLRRRY